MPTGLPWILGEREPGFALGASFRPHDSAIFSWRQGRARVVGRYHLPWCSTTPRHNTSSSARAAWSPPLSRRRSAPGPAPALGPRRSPGRARRRGMPNAAAQAQTPAANGSHRQSRNWRCAKAMAAERMRHRRGEERGARTGVCRSDSRIAEKAAMQLIAENRYLVPRAGVEPARPFSGKRRILSPQCLPISPSGRRLPAGARTRYGRPAWQRSAGRAGVQCPVASGHKTASVATALQRQEKREA